MMAFFSKSIKKGSVKASCGLGLEMAQFHYCQFLLVKINLKAFPGFREWGNRLYPFLEELWSDVGAFFFNPPIKHSQIVEAQSGIRVGKKENKKFFLQNYLYLLIKIYNGR